MPKADTKWTWSEVKMSMQIATGWKLHNTGLASSQRNLSGLMEGLGLFPPVLRVPVPKSLPPIITKTHRKN